MSQARLEFFFDCSSPWTYLAFSQIVALADKHKATLVWRPVLVGGVFNEVNQDVYAQRANPNKIKARYAGKDLQDWARLYGLRIIMPPSVFPVRAVAAQRGCLYALEQGCLPAWAQQVFRCYWADDKDISDPKILHGICKDVGLDPQAFDAAIARDDIKQALRANTQELITRGGFGSPTMFVNTQDMYFGNDRLPLVAHALAQASS